MSLGEAIATARRARGLTQADLADDLGITQAALSRYENELRQPTDGDLERIASNLGVVTRTVAPSRPDGRSARRRGSYATTGDR